MRSAAIFGLGTSHHSLAPFQQDSTVEWMVGMPASRAEADAIVVFGGDGTVHRHLLPMVTLGLPVLVVPSGSGNDFARALGFRKVRESLTAWRNFAAGGRNIREIDLGVITPTPTSQQQPEIATATGEPPARPDPAAQRYFCCVAGCGLDAEVTRRANQLPRWLRGHGGYAMSLPAALVKFAPFRLKVSMADESKNGSFAPPADQLTVLFACANTPVYGGGMKIAPRARLDDGKLDICHITDVDKLKLFCLFPSVYLGQHLALKEVTYLRSPGVRIEAEVPLDVYADGEYVCRTPAEISVAPAALKVIAP
jgi:diacylglycerol kinase (ATP)